MTKAMKSGALILAAWLVASAPAAAQTANPGGAPVDLSGFWELRSDSKNVDAPQLTPEYSATGGAQRR